MPISSLKLRVLYDEGWEGEGGGDVQNGLQAQAENTQVLNKSHLFAQSLTNSFFEVATREENFSDI